MHECSEQYNQLRTVLRATSYLVYSDGTIVQTFSILLGVYGAESREANNAMRL